jgi:hypothetical protein
MDNFYDRFGNEIEFVKTFKGDCMGVGLVQRGANDKHVCFLPIVEDDESWYISSGSSISSFWLPEMIEQFKIAEEWMKVNCEKDGAYGYKFK